MKTIRIQFKKVHMFEGVKIFFQTVRFTETLPTAKNSGMFTLLSLNLQVRLILPFNIN